LKYIGYSSFVNTNISSITIPDGVITIGSSAFAYTSLESVELGSVRYIEDYAFSGTKLSNIVIPSTVVSIGNSAFAGTSFLTSLTIPDETFYLGDNSFFQLPQNYNDPIPLILLNCINMDFSKPRSIGFQALPIVKPCNTESSGSNVKPPAKKPSSKASSSSGKKQKSKRKYRYATHSPSKKPTSRK